MTPSEIPTDDEIDLGFLNDDDDDPDEEEMEDDDFYEGDYEED
jgi:hypothetical protein